MRPLDEEVLARVDDDETLDLLQQLVRTPSGNPPGGEARVAEVLADFLRARGFEPRMHEVEAGRANLTADLRHGIAGTYPHAQWTSRYDALRTRLDD